MDAHAHPEIGVRTYLLIFAALMALLAATVAFAYLDLGWLNVPLMLAIAVTKCVLIILYFMHVRYSSQLTWVVVLSGFLWFLFLLGLLMMDYVSRDWLTAPSRWVG